MRGTTSADILKGQSRVISSSPPKASKIVLPPPNKARPAHSPGESIFDDLVRRSEQEQVHEQKSALLPLNHIDTAKAGVGHEERVTGQLLCASSPNPKVNDEHPALFITDTLEGWLQSQSENFNGLLAKRPFNGKWDAFQCNIDDACPRFGPELSLERRIANESSEYLATQVPACVDEILAVASLPASLNKQLRSDACAIAKHIASICPSACELEVKLEIFAMSICKRWHQDNYVGRAIVSYTGQTGTEYTRDSNVDFRELRNCGNPDHIIRNPDQIEAVEVGDILFIKGEKYPTSGLPNGATGLVHKSPEKRYHQDGRLVNRLVLKVDVTQLRDTPPEQGQAKKQRRNRGS
jgi:hypothetical protein